MDTKNLRPAIPPDDTDGGLVPADLSKLKPSNFDNPENLVPWEPDDVGPTHGLVPANQEELRRQQSGGLKPWDPGRDIASSDGDRELNIDGFEDGHCAKPIVTANPIIANNNPNLARLYIQPPDGPKHLKIPEFTPSLEIGTNWFDVTYNEFFGIYPVVHRTVDNQADYEDGCQDTLLGIYVPANINWNTAQVLVVVHGASRICSQYMVPFLGRGSVWSPFFTDVKPHRMGDDSLIALAIEQNLIVVCPMFERHHFPVRIPRMSDDGYVLPDYIESYEWNPRRLRSSDFFYRYLISIAIDNCGKLIDEEHGENSTVKREWDAWVRTWYREPESYMNNARFLFETEPWSDVYLNAVFKFVQDLFPDSVNPPRKFHLYGFSWGANFVTRYAFFNYDRLKSLIVGAPGHSLFPDLDIHEFAEVFGMDRDDQYSYQIRLFISGLTDADFSYPYTANLNSDSMTVPPERRFADFTFYDTELPLDAYYAYRFGTNLNKVLIAHKDDENCASSRHEVPEKYWQGPCPQHRIEKYARSWLFYLHWRFGIRDPHACKTYYWINSDESVTPHSHGWQLEWIRENWTTNIDIP